LEGFLVSDPPLQQVIARTKEAGLRGNFTTAGGRGDWKLGLFRIDSQNDIIQVASTLQGRGVFQNVPPRAVRDWRQARSIRPANTSCMPITPSSTPLISSRERWRHRTILSPTQTEISS
jgi:hypothetical protein